MIERKICQIINRDPNLIKILNKMPEPYKRHILTKHWCFQHEDRFGIIQNFSPGIWMELEPNIFNYSYLLSYKGSKCQQKNLMFSKISPSISSFYSI